MKTLLPFFLFLGLCLSLSAQQLQLTDIRAEQYNGLKGIQNTATQQTLGFYTFFVKDRVGGGKSNAVLRLYDLRQKLISESKVTLSTYSEVSSVAANEKGFLFAFKDTRSKRLTLISIDVSGAVVASKELKVEQVYQTEISILSAGQGGFYTARTIKEKTVGYRLEKVDITPTILWEKQVLPEKGYIGFFAATSDGERLLVTQAKAPAFLSKQVLGQLICFADVDGKELFIHDLHMGDKTVIPTNFLIDKSKNIVAVGMYMEGQHWWNLSRFDGIFFLKLSSDGEMLAYETTPWKGGLQTSIAEASGMNATLDNNVEVFFEDIIEEEGGYKIISEAFRDSRHIGGRVVAIRKSTSGKGHVLGFDGGPNSVAKKCEIANIVVFSMDKHGKLTGITPISKAPTEITLLEPYAGYGGITLAKAIKKDGYFDYYFTTRHPKTGEAILVTRKLGERPALLLHLLGTDGEIDSFTLDLNQMPGIETHLRIGTLAAQNGELLVFWHDKYEKKILLFLIGMEFNSLFSRSQ
jgi:hypothetical protein